MIIYTIRRLFMIIPVLIGVIFIVFTISYFMPGDPVSVLLGGEYTQEEYDKLEKELGLDQPYIVQLFNYYKALLQGDMGTSYTSFRPVTTEIEGRIWTSLKLGILSCIVTAILALPLGVISAVRQNSVLDYSVTTIAIFLASMPGFWLALMAIIVFCLNLGWLPATGLKTWKHYILPVACNALSAMAVTMRMTRSSMLEVIRQDYIRTARAKGLSEKVVVVRHALKNALIPVITVMGAQFSMVIGGSVIIESIFNIPGMGAKLVTAIGSRDYPLILGITLVLSVFTSVIMLIVDLAYAFADPRIKAQFSRSRNKAKKKATEEGAAA